MPSSIGTTVARVRASHSLGTRTGVLLTLIASIASLFIAPATVVAGPSAPHRGTTSTDAIVFARLQGDPEDYEIWTMGAHGGSQHRLTRNAVADDNPEWSPDGSRIAWLQSDLQFGGPGDVWMMDADGSNKHQITHHSEDVSGVSWSPDGSQLVYARSYGIWIVNADGTGEHRIVPPRTYASTPAWSPDGSRIAFASYSSSKGEDLFVVNPDGSDRARIVHTEGISEIEPAWSPDGERIAFSGSHRTSSWHVDVMRSDGGGVHIVVGRYSLDPAWSPDGSKLAFYACGTLDCSLYQSSDTGKHFRPLGRVRGFSDVDPDFRPVPRP